jgi:hypothetical protein
VNYGKKSSSNTTPLTPSRRSSSCFVQDEGLLKNRLISVHSVILHLP